MIETPRLYPEPLPAIFPLPEYAATGRRKEQYQDMKQVLQVPWMGVVTMAYAHYPGFFEVLWNGLKPLVQSRAFVEHAQALQGFVEDEVRALAPPPLEPRLRELGYAAREIDNIRDMIAIFSHGNHPYLLISTITRLLLEGCEIGGTAAAHPYEGRHAPQVQVPFVLLEAHHADAPTRAVYEDIKATLHLPFVNTDYRALARWPSYFALAWADLRKVANGPTHAAICAAIHKRATEAVVGALPNPGGLATEALRAAADKDASAKEVLQTCRLFQWLLPGLVTNVAFFRSQLESA
ncbi:MAG: hypothetical protein IH604_19975 [Burkholderiales bacterium]|nr:hypothetical protein [Burkholderiales bacterium]